MSRISGQIYFHRHCCSGNNNVRSAVNGFSLIEILIALVIGALLVGMSTLAFGDKRQQVLEEQSQRFYLLLQQAKDESMLRGIDIGIRVEPDHYLFYSLDQETEKWLPITDDDFFTKKDIPEELEIKLVVEGSTLFAEDDDDVDIFDEDVDIFEEEEDQIEPPQLYVLSSGEMSEFKFAIGWIDDEPRYYVVSGNLLGDLEFEGPLSGNLRVEVADGSTLNL